MGLCSQTHITSVGNMLASLAGLAYRPAAATGVNAMKHLQLAILITTLCSSSAWSECIARVYLQRLNEGPPVYLVESCQVASEYFKSNAVDPKISSYLRAMDHSDLAITLVAGNESAKSVLRGHKDTWHFRGECESVPIGKTVSLETNAHCSDGHGVAVHTYLGDTTITEFILNE